ncbi:hypothetical protein HN51_062495 [Arachis hypogaea]
MGFEARVALVRFSREVKQGSSLEGLSKENSRHVSVQTHGSMSNIVILVLDVSREHDLHSRALSFTMSHHPSSRPGRLRLGGKVKTPLSNSERRHMG